MKKILALAAALVLLLLCAVPVFAVDAKVLKGTPVVDGKLDDIYKQSGTLSIDSSMYIWGTKDKSKATSISYYLWDNDYLYVCTVVQDTTIVDTGIVSKWMADAVEMWITVNGAKSKSSVDAFNHAMYGDTPMTGGKQATTRAASSYIVEISIPLSKLGKIADGSKLAVSMQINDFWNKAPTGAADGVAYGSQKMGDNLVFSNTAGNVETTAAATTTKAAATTAAKAATTAAAKTADVSVVIAAVLVSAAAAAVVLKKKH